MNYYDYDSEDSDEWQIQHEPNGEQGCRSYPGCQYNQSYYSGQLGYMSYSQSSESYYSERNNNQDGYMYNVDAIHEERAKTQRRTEKLEVMIKMHGALTQLTEQWKIRQKELKELQKGLEEFRKEEDKARQKRHQKRKENKIRINSLSIGGESDMEKTLVIPLSSKSPIPLVIEKQEIVECLVIQEGKCDEKPRGEDPQITFYEDQNMVEIENSMFDMVMGDKANLSKPPTAMMESKAMIGQNKTILGGQENSSYLEPNEQENSTNFLAKSLYGLQKHEIHVENTRKSRLGVKHGWPPPMVQGLSALF